MIDAVVLGELDVVAVVPDARKPLEVRRVVLAAVRIVPEADRHRRERRRADQLALLLPRTDVPGLVEHLDLHAEPRAWISPRQTGPVGLPPTKQLTMSVPPEIDARWTSRLICSVDEVEALGDQRRAGRRHRPHACRGGAWRPARSPALATASMNLADVPKSVIPCLVGEIEQRVARPDGTGDPS